MLLQTHKIKKFVLHSNSPGHADFNLYIKCNFAIYSSDCKYRAFTAACDSHVIAKFLNSASVDLGTGTFP